MKLVISSYNTNNNALSLIDINMQKKEYKILDNIELIEPSFVISVNNIIFTYTKRPLELLAFTINNNKFVLIDRISVPLETMTHLAFNEFNNTLYGASYKDGAIISVKFNNKFSNLKVIKEGGKCHEVLISPNNLEIGIINIEKDQINIYNLDLKLLRIINLPLNSGPRHGKWCQNEMFVCSEYSNELFRIKDGIVIDKIKTIKEDSKSNCATLLLDNNYIYVSNRGEETIAKIDISSKLKYVTSFSVYGKHSRHMIFSSDKKYIISLNKNSNNIAIINKDNFNLEMSIPYDNCSGVAIYED